MNFQTGKYKFCFTRQLPLSKPKFYIDKWSHLNLGSMQFIGQTSSYSILRSFPGREMINHWCDGSQKWCKSLNYNETKIYDTDFAKFGIEISQIGESITDAMDFWKVIKIFPLNIYLSGGVLLAMMTNLALPWRSVFRVCLYPKTYFPLFITRARRELIFSILFFYTYKKNDLLHFLSKHYQKASSGII